MSELRIYTTDEREVAVRLEGETVWLTQAQMAGLFERERSVITKHLRNVFKEGELEETAVCANFAHTAADGKTYQTRFYNLDAILSVGYRVNSRRGVQFRQWATRVLREQLTQGYSLNPARLAERGIHEAEQAIALLARTLENQALVNDTGREVVALIRGYAKTWRLLLQYDEDRIALPEGRHPARSALDHPQASAAIAQLKDALLARGEATDLFGRPRGEAFEGLLGSIEQTMFGEPLYQSREEKAAHLLYFVIKDHPFSDGNKRIGSLLFLLYLSQEGMAMTVNENTLTALALLVAESQPGNKGLLIRLIVNLLTASEPNT
jgi:prophage maintenance system killer protein